MNWGFVSEDVLGYLDSKGIHTKRATKDNVHAACPFCGEGEGKRGRLYINIDPDAEIPGLFFCFLCGAKGSILTLKKHFGDPTTSAKDLGVDHFRILQSAADYYHKNLASKPDILNWLHVSRGLTDETISRFKLGWADGMVVPHLKKQGFEQSEIKHAGLVDSRGGEFFSGVVTIPYLIAGLCVGIRQKELGGKYKQPQGWTQRLFNTDALNGYPSEVLLTEGEFDAMIATQLGYAAVGVPGATQWQESWNIYFQDVRRVWVVFDNDDAGRSGGEKIHQVLGPKANVANIPPIGIDEDDHNDLSDWVVHQGHTAEDLTRHLSKHRSAGLLLTVDDAFAEYDEVQSASGLKFNFPTLDTLLTPGLLPGQVVVVLAKTNTGKTLWLINMFHRMSMVNDDLKFLFLSLEQTRGEWVERAVRIMGYYNLQYASQSSDPADLTAANEDLKQATRNFWVKRLWMTDKNRLTEDELVACIDEYEMTVGQRPDVVAIDYLGYLARGFEGKDKYEKTSNAIMSMKAIAKDMRVPIVSPHQVNRIGQFGQKLEIDMARDSVTGDTRVLLADGRYLPIKDLVGTNPEMVCVDPETYQYTTRRAHLIWEKPKPREVFEVTTQTGRKICGTAEHPLWTASGEAHIEDLRPGDRIAVAGTLPYFGTEHVEHAELLGFLQADGALTRTPVSFYKEETALLDRVEHLAKEFGITPTRSGNNISLCGHREHRMIAESIADWLKEIGAYGYKSPDRRVPECIYSAPKEDVAAYIRGLWTCDGTVVVNRETKYSSASRGLIEDLQHLLSRFGIQSNISKETHGRSSFKPGTFYWVLHVKQARSIALFAEEIGLVGAKGEKLKALAVEKSDTKPANCVDLYPANLLDEIHALRKEKGLGWSVLSHTGDPKKTSIVKGREILRSRLRFYADAVGSDRLRNLTESPLFFDKIISVEPKGVEPVYDAAIVQIHNFVANGVIGVNSGTVEESADFVFSLWNPDHGKPPEERSGKIGLSIGKSRHGGAGESLWYRFSPMTLALVPEECPESHMALQELEFPKDSWQLALWRHRTGKRF